MDEKKIVLIVDDVELNRAFLRDMLENKYGIIEASNGLEAIELIKKFEKDIAVVLLDAIMPEMDGFGVLDIMNKNRWIENIPVIMISVETSPDFIENGYALGVIDYISRPFSAEIVMHRVQNTILLYAKQNMLQKIVQEQIREREKNNTLMVDILSTVVEFRNGESGIHVQRIRIITEILLESLMRHNPDYGITASLIAMISNAAALHDIGKIVIDEKILNKPGKLTPEEFAIMKTHAAKGAEMLQNIHEGQQESLLIYAHDICRWHHERWDGRGYPDGLHGSEIPLCAQVVSIADVYDALVSKRVYKPAFSKEKALQMIINNECGVFNPDILDCLLRESKVLEEKVYRYSSEYDRILDIEQISEEIISPNKPVVSDRTLTLLEKERLKYQSFAALSDEVLFEYDILSDTLTFTEAGAIAMNLPLKIVSAKRWIAKSKIISKQDYRHIYDSFVNSNPEYSVFKHQCVIHILGGVRKWVEFKIQTMWSHNIEAEMYGCLGKVSDMTEQKKEKDRLKFLAEKDVLTMLYNKRTGTEKVSRILENSKLAAIIFMDVDNFKNINDTYGHLQGDIVLQGIATHILDSIKKNDVAIRLGGDEFLICLQGFTERAQMEEHIDKFWKGLQAYFSSQDIDVSMSMGVAMYPDNGQDYQALVTNADYALYASKNAGKNRCTFCSSMVYMN